MHLPRLEFPTLLLLLLILHTVTIALVDDVIVDTQYGRLQGRRIVEHYDLGPNAVTNTVDEFLGVPYAAPPVGERRFKAPVSPEPWTGILNATSHGWVCPQLVFYTDTKLSSQREDCLYLNIYTPFQKNDTDARYPVMMFIHGGSFEVGSGKLYDGSVLAKFGVVVITINYRLGALGFLTSGDSALRGNFGLLDQIHALQWVQENIDRFRGDKSRVTVFGHSAGGSSAGLLLLIPQAKGLFHRAIGQSGSAVAPYSFHVKQTTSNPHGVNFHNYLKHVGKVFHCSKDSMTDIASCLRDPPARNFILNREKFPLYDPIDPEFRPLVDGDLLPDDPREMYRTGNFNHVPMMVGTVKDEFVNYFNGGERHETAFDQALDNYLMHTVKSQSIVDVVQYEYTHWDKPGGGQYDRGRLLSDLNMVAPTVDLASLASRHQDNVYQYHFSATNCFHSLELNFVFGTPFSGKFADEMTPPNSNRTFSEEERDLSRLVMTLWSNFAKHGHPTPPGNDSLTKWLSYHPDKRGYLHISAETKPFMGYNLQRHKVMLWNSLVRKLKAEYLSTLLSVNETEGGLVAAHTQQPGLQYQTGMWVFVGISIVLLVLLLFVLFLFITSLLDHNPHRYCLAGYQQRHEVTPTKV